MSLHKDETGRIDYRSRRTHRGQPPCEFDASYSPVGDSFYAQPGSLEHWLTARYCLYSADRNGRVYRGEIDHDPWELSQANWSVSKNSMGSPWQFKLRRPPIFYLLDQCGTRLDGQAGVGAKRKSLQPQGASRGLAAITLTITRNGECYNGAIPRLAPCGCRA